MGARKIVLLDGYLFMGTRKCMVQLYVKEFMAYGIIVAREERGAKLLRTETEGEHLILPKHKDVA